MAYQPGISSNQEAIQPEPESNPERISLKFFFEQVREDWIAHDRDWTKPGFRAVFTHRFGVWRMSIKSKLFRAPFSLLYRMMYRKARNTYGIELPYTVKLGRRVIFEHQGCIVIHGNCVIDDDSIIRQGVTLGLRYLNKPFDAPCLGRRVNVGAGAKLFGNICIGDDVNIGANAVVLSDIPSGCTAVGIPAKIIYKTKDNVIVQHSK
jgi:serine O-acetyltransferase